MQSVDPASLTLESLTLDTNALDEVRRFVVRATAFVEGVDPENADPRDRRASTLLMRALIMAFYANDAATSWGLSKDATSRDALLLALKSCKNAFVALSSVCPTDGAMAKDCAEVLERAEAAEAAVVLT